MAYAIDLTGTVALVTGASRGLGRAAAVALAEAGADLALTGRRADDLASAAEEVAKRGVRAEVFRGDVREPADIDRVVSGTLDAFGRIDVLVNNAGVSGGAKAFVDLEPGDWDDVLAVNVRGPALYARAVARAMIARGRGRIVNVASIAALSPFTRLGPYCASKAALVHLTRVMALELTRHGIQVNAICPGYFATEMNEAFFASAPGQQVIQRSIPMRRLGEPAELGPTLVFLASDASSFMTGSVIVVDGGQTLT
jgi:NAD(P)-dependent dehydrogenase (short-subunit alcohol dehydrogenase family)